MPCRCCGASRPSKGFKEPGEVEINDLLKQAAKLIRAKDDGSYEDINEWNKAWQEAFDHHLNGCRRK